MVEQVVDPAKRAPRYRVNGLTVIYDTAEEFWTGPVLDASTSGLFIATAHDLPVGTRLTIMPDGHEDERIPFEVTGVVVRVNELDWTNYSERGPGIAVRLEGLSEGDSARFQAFLREHGTVIEPGS